MNREQVDAAIDSAIAAIGKGSFSTADFMNTLRTEDSAAWKEIVATYGEGGRGSGSHYSAAVFIAQQLDKKTRSRALAKLDYRPAPPHWGNAIIRYWVVDRATLGGHLYPGEGEGDAKRSKR